MRFDQSAQAASHHLVIVCQKDASCRHISSFQNESALRDVPVQRQADRHSRAGVVRANLNSASQLLHPFPHPDNTNSESRSTARFVCEAGNIRGELAESTQILPGCRGSSPVRLFLTCFPRQLVAGTRVLSLAQF
jgi:hypothetical protein